MTREWRYLEYSYPESRAVLGGGVQAQSQLRNPTSLSPLVRPTLGLSAKPGLGQHPPPRSARGQWSFLLSLVWGQMGNGGCTSSKGATSGKSQRMAMFQSPVHYRKGGLGCPPILRLLQCHWKMETSTSSKVSALSQLRLRRGAEGGGGGGGDLPEVKRGEDPQQ